jgi:hypothetical protein
MVVGYWRPPIGDPGAAWSGADGAKARMILDFGFSIFD